MKIHPVGTERISEDKQTERGDEGNTGPFFYLYERAWKHKIDI